MSEPNLLQEQAYIAGVWCDAASLDTLAITNPATGKVIAHVPKMGAEETQTAIKAA
ncbi:Succinate-semialdehyde dehydrogenase [NAD(P)+], partial [hydrothermal vent metagenome]